MTDKPEDQGAPAPRTLTVLDVNHAPVIYFDGPTNWGINSGIVNITLAFDRRLVGPGGVKTDVIAVAHLRTPVAALHVLKSVVDELVLAATPPATDKVN